jgi:hypothetical protein
MIEAVISGIGTGGTVLLFSFSIRASVASTLLQP